MKALRVAVPRTIYPAADKPTALAEMAATVLRNAENLVVQGQLQAGQSLEQYCQWMNISYGHPDEVGATLQVDRLLPYTTDLSSSLARPCRRWTRHCGCWNISPHRSHRSWSG